MRTNECRSKERTTCTAVQMFGSNLRKSTERKRISKRERESLQIMSHANVYASTFSFYEEAVYYGTD